MAGTLVRQAPSAFQKQLSTQISTGNLDKILSIVQIVYSKRAHNSEMILFFLLTSVATSHIDVVDDDTHNSQLSLQLNIRIRLTNLY